MGLHLGKRSGAPWGAEEMPLALLSRLNRSFAMRFGLMCLSAIAVSRYSHQKRRDTRWCERYIMNTNPLTSSYVGVNLVGKF